MTENSSEQLSATNRVVADSHCYAPHHVEVATSRGNYLLNVMAKSCADAMIRARLHIRPDDKIVSSHAGEMRGASCAYRPFYEKA